MFDKDLHKEYVFLNNYLPREAQVSIGEGGLDLLSGKEISGQVNLPAKGILIYQRKFS